MKKISECPICGSNIKSNYEICSKCGWEFDPIQNENICYAGGANDLSIIEYKDLYQLCISKKKNFTYKTDREMINLIINKLENPPYMCKSCGKHEIKNIGEECPICGWICSPYQELFEDRDSLLNKMSLHDYKK